MGRTTYRTGGVTFDMFFDRSKVLEQVERKEASALNRVGGASRLIVQRSMRPGGKAGKSSEPGEPPRTQTGLLKRHTYYGYDSGSRSVVIGAMPLRKSTGNVPMLLETGGAVRDGFIRVKRKRPIIGRDGKKLTWRLVKKTFNMKPRPWIGERSINHPKIMETFRKIIAQQGLT